MPRAFFLLFFLLAACTNTTPWTLDTIVAGDKRYDSSRLKYQNQESFSPIRLEFLKMGESVDLILSLTQYSFTPTQETPSSVLVRFTIGDNSPYEEMVPLCVGHMRLRISNETTNRIIKALQEGIKVDILIDDLAETIPPRNFAKNYKKFMGNDTFFRNPFKGSFQ